MHRTNLEFDFLSYETSSSQTWWTHRPDRGSSSANEVNLGTESNMTELCFDSEQMAC